jgi:hypothetical protein
MFTLTDPDEDNLIRLEVDFGDEVLFETCGCDKIWYNGITVEITHKWVEKGTFNITARVQDEKGLWSEWSEPIYVIMPYINNFISV